jgi:hypothetical protein
VSELVVSSLQVKLSAVAFEPAPSTMVGIFTGTCLMVAPTELVWLQALWPRELDAEILTWTVC